MTHFHQYDATLSKTLIDAKDRLGSLYFEAKLIECPQNAIELKKLLKKYEQLEKEYSRDVSDVKRSQQMLSISLTNYLKSDRRNKSSSSLVAEETGELAGPLAPGFRFHANGEPKRKNGITGYSDHNEQSRYSAGNYVDAGHVQNDFTVLPRKRIFINRSTSKVGSSVDDTSPQSPRKSSPERENQERNRHQSNRNYRFAFKPGTINFGKSEGKILRITKNRRSSLRPACSACQVKLKYSDEAIKKMKSISKDPLIRWQIAPRGCYVKTPFSYQELDRMVSNVSLNTKSTSELLQRANHSVPSELNTEFRGSTSPSDKPSTYAQLQSICFDDSRGVSSARGTTLLYRNGSARQNFGHLKTTQNYPHSNKRLQSEQFEEKPSLVSFSPSTTAVSSGMAISPSTGRSRSQFGSTNTFGSYTSFSRDSSSRLGRQSSHQFWRPVLEDERKQCEEKVHLFLKKLGGGYVDARPETGQSVRWPKPTVVA